MLLPKATTDRNSLSSVYNSLGDSGITPISFLLKWLAFLFGGDPFSLCISTAGDIKL